MSAEELAAEIEGYSTYLAVHSIDSTPLMKAAALIRQQATVLATAERKREEAGADLDHCHSWYSSALKRAAQAEAALATAREDRDAARRKMIAFREWLDDADRVIGPVAAANVSGIVDHLGFDSTFDKVRADAPAARGEET